MNLRNQIGERPGAVAELRRGATGGLPDYIDSDGDGFPENREVDGKGKRRISVGFRTGGHAGGSLPITAEGPGASLFIGYMDQTDIPFKIAQALAGTADKADALLLQLLRVDQVRGAGGGHK